eukprot:780222-Pyramimonas_sp.AAC.1
MDDPLALLLYSTWTATEDRPQEILEETHNFDVVIGYNTRGTSMQGGRVDCQPTAALASCWHYTGD